MRRVCSVKGGESCLSFLGGVYVTAMTMPQIHSKLHIPPQILYAARVIEFPVGPML